MFCLLKKKQLIFCCLLPVLYILVHHWAAEDIRNENQEILACKSLPLSGPIENCARC